MGMPTHITKEDRKAIDYFLRCNWKQIQIAELLGRNKSVISREIRRNSKKDGIYQYGYAHKQYLKRRKWSKYTKRKIIHDKKLRDHILKRLTSGDSPEQISGRIRYEKKMSYVCSETIYTWIYEQEEGIQKLLPFKKNKYRRRRGSKKRAKTRRMNQFRCIETRSVEVDQKTRLGDFEGDTVIGGGKKERLLTHVDRKSGYGFVDLLHTITSEIIQKKTIECFQKLPHSKRHTITYDRGTEFGGDDTIVERGTGMEIYRAHAYHSWERGCNENFNGLLRRFFPKGSSFATLTQADVDEVTHILNHRPRKRLNYLTPHEVFVLGKKVVVEGGV